MELLNLSRRTILLVLSLLLAAVWLFHSVSIAAYDANWDGKTADCGIVLGAAVWGSAPSPVYRARLDYGIELAKKHSVRRLIFTGGTGYGKEVSEGDVGKNYAVKQGLSGDRLFVENRSFTTKQNLANSLPIVEKEQCSRILIISDPYHLKRAVEMARDLNLDAYPAATPQTMFRTWRTKFEFLMSETYYLLQYRVFNS